MFDDMPEPQARAGREDKYHDESQHLAEHREQLDLDHLKLIRELLPSPTVAPNLFGEIPKTNREPACTAPSRHGRASPRRRHPDLHEPLGSSEDSDDFVDLVFDYVKREVDFAPGRVGRH